MKSVLTPGVLKLLCAAALALPFAFSARADVCHVYVVDVAKVERAREMWEDLEAREKALDGAEVSLPEFTTVVGEEVETRKTFPFPGVANLFITASVFYTDESMASAEGFDSMLLVVAVGGEDLKEWPPEHALAEITHAGADTARVKKYVKVRGRSYLVGMECHVKPRQRGEQ